MKIHYSALYEGTERGITGAVERFDTYMDTNNELIQLLRELSHVRMDIVSSDREVMAFMMSLRDLGIKVTKTKVSGTGVTH